MRYLSRARLRTDAPVASLRSLLLPDEPSARVSAAHKLVWALFADGPERSRDFLWREASPGVFYLLSVRPPSDPHGMFELDSPREFQPALLKGERLRFSLRANATVSPSRGQGERGLPQDVVMHALHGLDGPTRSQKRALVVVEAGRRWLQRQGERCGFAVASPEDIGVTGHRVLTLARAGRPARLGVLDFEGVLEVTDPDRLVEAIVAGLGRGKAFGNGLMLIRRA
jgi:CRISPR system Cascade subunit CasE